VHVSGAQNADIRRVCWVPIAASSTFLLRCRRAIRRNSPMTVASQRLARLWRPALEKLARDGDAVPLASGALATAAAQPGKILAVHRN